MRYWNAVSAACGRTRPHHVIAIDDHGRIEFYPVPETIVERWRARPDYRYTACRIGRDR